MRHEIRTAGGTKLAVLNTGTPADGWGEDQWDAMCHRAEELLAEYGTVMIRGVGVADADAFHDAVSRFGGALIDSYRGGNTPRSAVSEGVFTSTEYPARYDITLHNEMSYAKTWPSRLYFGCLIAAETGGATPVCDGEALLESLPPGVRARFSSGIVYRRHLHGGFGLGKSWQDTYETQDRAVVEAFLKETAAEYEWTADGGLRVMQHRPGIRINPRTGRYAWFNQADQWHPSNLPDEEAELLLSLIDTAEDLPHWTTFADGTLLTDDDLAHVRKAQRENMIAEPWQAGDIMIVDNMSVLHGRESFTGARKVVVAMT